MPGLDASQIENRWPEDYGLRRHWIYAKSAEQIQQTVLLHHISSEYVIRCVRQLANT
jgi:hypothetical protein